MIAGKSKLDRKKNLASIVAGHLVSLGHTASVVEGRVNSAGHRDQVLVDSAIGLVHVTASSNTEPNGSILCSDIEDGDQSFLADKEVVAFGWNTGDGRTTVMLVPAEAVRGNKSMTKDQIRSASIRAYTLMLGPHA
ncbi:hypothetical protein [Xanthomonas sp. SHU 199]|uniref:hypothetical protein n=1 Tax=Xanthomonas sp. SHU 199 TaxID=1591174 RepID=UPI0003822358|nr:hypothetical protein [Xanthomonas sp. SHU 199]